MEERELDVQNSRHGFENHLNIRCPGAEESVTLDSQDFSGLFEGEDDDFVPIGLPVVPAPSGAPTNRSIQQTKFKYAHAEWGSAHPQRSNTDGMRVPWSAAEIAYVGNWATKRLSEYPEAKKLMQGCLDHLRTDPVGMSIFHKNHILNAERLKTGYRAYLSKKDDGANESD